MKRSLLYILLLCVTPSFAWDWWPLPMAEPDDGKDTIAYEMSLGATAGYGTYSPYWLQSGQYGTISSAPFSGYIKGAIVKPATRPHRWFDYDGAVALRATVHSPMPNYEVLPKTGVFPVYQQQQFTSMVERCYAHARLYIIDIAAGVMPITDDMYAPLSTGSLLFSDNAPAIPAISIGISRWTAVPGLYGYLEIKGGLLHAWLTDNAYTRGSMLHYKHLGVQAGGKLPVNISYEFHHAAQWGGYSPTGTDLGNDIKSLKNVFFAKAGGNSYNELYNAQGNHVGSQQLAITAKGTGWQCKVYWQNFLEDNFAMLGQGQNLPDGRWGITAEQHIWQYINTLTIEYICTADQSGPMHDQDGIIYAGNDSYYRNGIYKQGWNYYLRSLGTPLITAPLYNSKGETQTLNSRVRAFHFGAGGDIQGFKYSVLLTHVRNYGNYSDGDWYSQKSHNTALCIEVNKRVEKAWGLLFGIRLAADIGTQWGNQAGAMLTISKQGIIKDY